VGRGDKSARHCGSHTANHEALQLKRPKCESHDAAGERQRLLARIVMRAQRIEPQRSPDKLTRMHDDVKLIGAQGPAEIVIGVKNGLHLHHEVGSILFVDLDSCRFLTQSSNGQSNPVPVADPTS
jgi:hypothetical protein